MPVKVAKTAGFCMGVKRAMDIVLDAAEEKEGTIYTYGPLIHNPQVIAMLEKKDVRVIHDLQEWDTGRVVIRTHGISPDIRKKIKEKATAINDATCPLVARVQGIIKRHARKGYHTVIVGDKDHAEIIGLMGFTQQRGIVINSLEEIEALPFMEKICVVGQTTLNKKKYQEIAHRLKDRFSHCMVEDTVCDATDERQSELLRLAKQVEAVVVVGGKNSANTNHLVRISESVCVHTFHVETEEDLDEASLYGFEHIGVTAGASTPTWLIRRVVERIEEIGRKKRKGWSKLFLGSMEFLVKSNLYIAIGAAFLTYSASQLSGIAWQPVCLIISFFYFFAMYNLNNFTDWEVVKLNEPDRISFYEKHYHLLYGLGICSLILSTTLSFIQGFYHVTLMLISTGFGIAYSVKLLPESTDRPKRIRRLKDIPASKDIFVAFAWALVTTLVPAVSSLSKKITPSLLVSFIFVFLIIYIRSVLFDIRDIQGDRFVGRETVPILIGNEKAKVFLLILSAFTVLVLFCAVNIGIVSSIGYFMIFPVCYTVFYVYLYHKGIIGQGISCEWVVDGTLILTGLTGMLYSLF